MSVRAAYCAVAAGTRHRLIDHHITYQPESTIKICEFCHWVIHRPCDVQALMERIKARYVEHFGPLPLKRIEQAKQGRSAFFNRRFGLKKAVQFLSMRGTQSNALTLCVALRHLGSVREIVVLKVNGDNFYAFPPYAKEPFGNVDGHMSWHASGERHAVFRLRRPRGWEYDRKMQQRSKTKLSPPAMLKGVGSLYHSGISYSQFHNLLPIGTNKGPSVVLDCERASFKDDFTVIKVYLVEPGMEANIPISPDTGPRILHLIKQTKPWMAVEVFQQGR